MPDRSRLFLITPPIADATSFAPVLDAALDAAEVACVLLRLQAGDPGAAKAAIRTLAPLAQRREAAALVETEARLAVRAEADGVHLWCDPSDPSLAESLRALQPDRIVGIGGLVDRDAAMRAGEAGVDYVMFGGPDLPDAPEEVRARAQWWAEIFNVPCVAYARDPGSAGTLATTGAEFVALCEGLWGDPRETTDRLRAVARDLAAVGALSLGEAGR